MTLRSGDETYANSISELCEKLDIDHDPDDEDFPGETLVQTLDDRDAEYVFVTGDAISPHVVIRLTPDPDQ